MSERPTISIAMATYNGERFLGQQLLSLVSQARLPDELVITDDDSTDSTIEIAERFAAMAPFPVQIHRNAERRGFSGNFQRALSLCTGTMLFICDQDDEWYPAKIERVLQAMADVPGALAVFHDQHLIDNAGRRYPATYMGNVAALGYSGSELQSGNCTAIRSELLEILAPFPEIMFYDAWINLLARLLDSRIVLPEPLQAYRRHDSNATGSAVTEPHPSKWRTFLDQGMSDPRPGWRWNIARLHAARDRIVERRDRLDDLLGTGRVAGALVRIDRELGNREARLLLANEPRSRRWAGILAHWRKGAYDDFSGLRSALVDMVRR